MSPPPVDFEVCRVVLTSAVYRPLGQTVRNEEAWSPGSALEHGWMDGRKDGWMGV